MPPPEARLQLAAAAALCLVLVVVVASAAIRLSSGELGELLPIARGTHRASASVATLVIALVGWLAWRCGRRALAAAIVAVTLALSILGAATGISPPPPAAAGNLLGGLLLAGLLAWLLGGRGRLAWPLAALALQVCLGAWLAVFAEDVWSWALLAHALLGIALAAGVAWTALKLEHAPSRLALMGLSLAVPATGFASALFDLPLAATFAHAAAAALLVGVAAYGHARLA